MCNRLRKISVVVDDAICVFIVHGDDLFVSCVVEEENAALIGSIHSPSSNRRTMNRFVVVDC